MGHGRRLLLIEDDRDIRETLLEALELEGYLCVAAIDGLDAIERLRHAPSLPDIIVLDLMMPRMNGAQFCQERSKVAAWADIPIIVLSADSYLKDRAAECGAAAYLAKPVELEMLLATITSALARSR